MKNGRLKKSLKLFGIKPIGKQILQCHGGRQTKKFRRFGSHRSRLTIPKIYLPRCWSEKNNCNLAKCHFPMETNNFNLTKYRFPTETNDSNLAKYHFPMRTNNCPVAKCHFPTETNNSNLPKCHFSNLCKNRKKNLWIR